MNHYQADQEIPENNVYDYGLWNLNRILVEMRRSLANFPLMSLPQQQWAHRIPNPLLQAEQYDVDKMATLVNEQRIIFNPDQATAFDAILESVTNNQGHLFFIHAAGGCGKTFLCNTIVAEVKRRGQCHKLHSVISPPFLRRFPRSQSQLKALKKTFRSMPVTSRGDQ